MLHKTTSHYKTFYGLSDKTIGDVLKDGQGKIFIKNNYQTHFKNQYYFTENGFIVYQMDGREIKTFCKNNDIKIFNENRII